MSTLRPMPILEEEQVSRTLSVQGSVPDGPTIQLQWGVYECEGREQQERILDIGGFGGLNFQGHGHRGVSFATTDSRVLRAFALLFNRLAEVVEAEEIGGTPRVADPKPERDQ